MDRRGNGAKRKTRSKNYDNLLNDRRVPPQEKRHWDEDLMLELLEDIIEFTFKNNDACTMYSFFKVKKNTDKWDIKISTFYQYIMDWRNKSDKVTKKYEMMKKLMEEKLKNNALKELWNPSFSKFLLNTKHNYITKTEQDLNVKDNTIKFEFGDSEEKEEGGDE